MEDHKEDHKEEINQEMPIITKEMMIHWMSNELPDEIIIDEDLM